MKTAKAFLLVLLLAGAVCAAPPATDRAFLALPPAEQEASAPAVLKTKAAQSDIWALGGVGFAGTRPLKFVAYQAILRRKDAPARFAELLRYPDVQTQLYALKGLSVVAPQTFRRMSVPFAHRTDTVRRGQGCLLSTVSVGELVREMQTEINRR